VNAATVVAMDQESSIVQAVQHALDALEGAVLQVPSKQVLQQIMHGAKQRCRELQQVGCATPRRLCAPPFIARAAR
jgi:hypothetical protein